MNTRSIRLAVLSATVALLAGMPTTSWAGDSHMMKNGPVLTAKEAKTLAATATSPKDHLKLALYFNQQAGQFEADAKDHDGMIEAYRKTPNPRATKTPGGVGTIEHCEFFAKSDREMAKAFREIAAAHEEMAREARER